MLLRAAAYLPGSNGLQANAARMFVFFPAQVSSWHSFLRRYIFSALPFSDE